jgi:hypothetical protein
VLDSKKNQRFGYPEFVDRHLGIFHIGSIGGVVKNGDEGAQVVTSGPMVMISYRQQR